MKSSLKAIAALFLVALVSMTIAAPAGVDTSPCCDKHSKKAFPRNIVVEYFYTRSTCNLHSIVFKFRNGAVGCADPNIQWAQDLVKYLDKMKHSTS